MKLYRHLAWDGIRKNSRLYVPYLLTGVGAVSFFYILVALSRLPEGTLPGSGSVQVILNLGSFVLWVFSLLLLFYTHSFLIRRRNREFALYNVLGMGKRDIARILCWETLLSGGISLASICILGTMVLVMLSSTTCLYFGAEDSLHTRYPRDENITAYFPDRASQSGDLTSLRTAVADAVRRSGMSAANVWEYRSVSSVMTLRDGVLSPNEGFGDPVDVTLIPLADYNAAMGTDLTLSQGQVYVCRSRTGYQGTSLTLQNGPTWQVAGLLDNFSPSGSDSASVVTQLWLIVPDLSAADALEQVMNRANMGVSRTWHYGFDLDRQLPDAADPVAEAIRRMAQDGGLMENGVLGVESLAENRGDFYGSYGSLFFLGILLSVGFSLAAVLIIYYKQISEGYEDQARFDIMQKVGMTRRDIRSSINSQLLLVFFLPLLLAGLHLAFAFPFVHKLLLLFNLWNTRLLVGTTAASFLAFAALYTLVYRITSNAYYHIVSGGGER